MSGLDIIIVSYNTRALLEACLRSLHDPAPQVAHAVTVVDNASTDGSVEAVRSHWHGVRLIEAGEHIGYARANNLALRQTTRDLVLLLNSDTVVPAGAVDRLVSVLEAADDVVAVGPRLVDAEGSVELSFGPMISPFSELIQKCKGAALVRQTPVVASWVEQALSRPGHPDWVSGACLLVRRRSAEAVGLLDERFFLYGEDVDFCAALRKHGRLLFTPEVEVVHHGGRSGSTAAEQTRAHYRRSQLAFYAKHHPAWVPALRLYLRMRGHLPPRLL